MNYSEIIQLLHAWCKVKISLLNKERDLVFNQGDIWWCSIGMNLGEEIFGKGKNFTRPVLVFRKFTHNSFLGLPVTSNGKQGSWYAEISLRGEKNWVLLQQARILDKKRLTNRIETLDGSAFKNVKERFLALYQ